MEEMGSEKWGQSTFLGEMYSDPIFGPHFCAVLLAPAQLLNVSVVHAEVVCDLVDQRAVNFLA